MRWVGNELASIWNDPEFTRRLIGSYGFASDFEPRLTPEEQAVYRDKIVPLLREDPKKAIGPLEALVKPSASAVFDFTLGNVYFQNEDLTNAVKHFEAALAKFPEYTQATLLRKAQKVKPRQRAALPGEGRTTRAGGPCLSAIRGSAHFLFKGDEFTRCNHRSTSWGRARSCSSRRKEAHSKVCTRSQRVLLRK